jgi:hypothetical protein
MFPCSHMGLDYLLDVNIFQYIVSGDYVLASFFLFSLREKMEKKKKNITNSCWFSYVYSFPSLFSFFYEKRKGGKGKEILAIT